ncbi:hypothetical protein SprV_0401441700 [Sparganum proliferum]
MIMRVPLNTISIRDAVFCKLCFGLGPYALQNVRHPTFLLIPIPAYFDACPPTEEISQSLFTILEEDPDELLACSTDDTNNKKFFIENYDPSYNCQRSRPLSLQEQDSVGNST